MAKRASNNNTSDTPTNGDSTDPSMQNAVVGESNQADTAAQEVTNSVKKEVPDIIAAVVGDMPHVHEHAINAVEDGQDATGDDGKPQVSTANGSIGAVDKFGRSFDPSIHAVNPDGSPRLTSEGQLQGKRGRKAGQKNGSQLPTQNDSEKEIPISKAEVIPPFDVEKCRTSAKIVACCIFSVGHAVGGDEWKPEVDPASGRDEVVNMENALFEYFKVRGIQDVPPSFGLAVALGSYVVPRCFRPQTKQRIVSTKEKFIRWWSDFKIQRQLKKERQAASKNANMDLGAG